MPDQGWVQTHASIDTKTKTSYGVLKSLKKGQVPFPKVNVTPIRNRQFRRSRLPSRRNQSKDFARVFADLTVPRRAPIGLIFASARKHLDRRPSRSTLSYYSCTARLLRMNVIAVTICRFCSRLLIRHNNQSLSVPLVSTITTCGINDQYPGYPGYSEPSWAVPNHAKSLPLLQYTTLL